MLIKSLIKHIWKGLIKSASNNWLILFMGLAAFDYAKDKVK